MRSRGNGEDNPAVAGSSGLDHSGSPVCFVVRRLLLQIHSTPIAMPRKAIPPRTAPTILRRDILEDNIDATNDEVGNEVSDGVSDGVKEPDET